MTIIVIPEGISEEDLESRARVIRQAKEAEPKPEKAAKRPKGWAALWEEPHPADDYVPPPLLTPGEVVAYRESKGWYQRHLAARTGYSTKSILHMEVGQTPVSFALSGMIRAMMEVDRLTEENERLKAALEAR